jgi:hypothetical protein
MSYQRKELIGNIRIALFDGRQDAGHIAHEVKDNHAREDRQTIPFSSAQA